MLFGTLTSSLLVGGILGTGVTAATQKKNYIVNLMPSELGPSTNGLLRRQELQESASIDPVSILYNYANALEGFAATLTDDEVNRLNAQPQVVSVREERVFKTQTTRTPQFLGLVGSNELLGTGVEYSGISYGEREVDAAEANIIIGVLDTGVWPENPSYNDAGMPDIPSHWKGSCEVGEQWTKANCNKKLIGAAFFYQGFAAVYENNTGLPFNFTAAGQIGSARDSEGHGTHTSTTAAGSLSANVSIFGQASGTARGMAKDARLAMYKVCWDFCYESDVMAGIDRAIADGVNVISGSLGGDPNFFGDAITTGSFVAMEKGIFTSFSGGNSGPDQSTISNNAPWMLTVAASTLDRDFPATVVLGNGRNLTGVSLYSNGAVPDVKPLSSHTVLPLILSSNAGSNVTAAKICLEGSLDPKLVAGKIVVCIRGVNARTEKGAVVKAAGGRGMVLVNDPASGEGIVSDSHVLPAIHIGVKAGALVVEYAKSGHATASLDFEGTRVGIPAPVMAAFSSRGPNGPIPQIMKPDITGPGMDIIAGWTRFQGPSGATNDTRVVDYNIISGTSMSCPHLAGIAAYIMARRPGWSIAAIRSAMMTTAYSTTKGTSNTLLDSATSNAATPFDYGNGHVSPVPALNPGLIYDITAKEYKEFVCSVNSTQAFMVEVTRSNFTCKKDKVYSPYALNYPSFGAYYDTTVTNGTYYARFPRTVTNVGGAGKYTASLSVDDKSVVEVSVNPNTLTFAAAGEKKTFELVVKMNPPPPNVNLTGIFLSSHGRLEWSDGKHTVGSSLGFIWR
ncbi:PA domain-containing protein [Rhexocercosporidium sp. MPI-PUGE-AT-0058]|nr:PA domain-containing protein [Rhexocercosporidium sp. MPI-PUGE-AT-0058]